MCLMTMARLDNRYTPLALNQASIGHTWGKGKENLQQLTRGD